MAAGAKLGALLAVVSLLVASCSGDEEPQIEVAPARIGSVAEVVEAPATVAARASATLTAAADGTVAELLVADGDVVTTGQTILTIDSPAANEQLRQARRAYDQASASSQVELPSLGTPESLERSESRAKEAFAAAREAAEQIPDPDARAEALAAVARAEADASAARSDAERAIRRFNAGLGSLAEAMSALGRSQLVQARAAVDVAQRTVDALTVKSPIDGVVSLGAASPGTGGSQIPGLPPDLQGAAEQALGQAAGGGGGDGTSAVGTIAIGTPVSAGQQLVAITDVSQLSLTAEVDETDVLLVQPGISATAELDALPGTSYDATVASVDVSPIATSRGGVAYRVRLTLGGGRTADGEVAPAPRPGMSAVVSLNVRQASGVVTVPPSAIVRVDNRDAVWLVVDDVVQRRYVRLGAQGPDTVEITEGLSAGQQVVVRGADQVREGQRLEQ